MVNMGITKVYKNNQTTIPSKLRKILNVSEKSIINWNLNPDNSITLNITNKKYMIKL